jgi:hypothetical protein
VTAQTARLRAEIASLERSFEPGERVVAETFGQAGRVPWWEVPATYAACALAVFGGSAAIFAFLSGRHGEAGLLAMCSAPSQLATFMATRRKAGCIVVTTRFVYLIRLPSNRRGRSRFMRCPIACVRVAADRTSRFRRVIRLEGPDLPVDGLQFLVTGQWRHDVDELIDALRPNSDGIGPTLVA